MKYKQIVIFMLLLIFPTSVWAFTGELLVECSPKEVAPGNTIKCNIKGITDEVITGVEADIKLSDSVTVESFKKSGSIWHDASLNDNKSSINAFTEDLNVSGTFDVGFLVLKVNDGAINNVEISLKNIAFSDKNFNLVKGNIVSNKESITIKKESASQDNDSDKKESDNNKSDYAVNNDKKELFLDNMVIKNYQLDFKKDVYDYSLVVGDETTLDIDLSYDQALTCEVAGNENLINNSLVTIYLTDGTDNVTYTIKIIKNDNKTKVNKDINAGEKKRGLIIFVLIVVVLVAINVYRIINKRRRNR